MDVDWFRQNWGLLSMKHTDGSAQRIERGIQASGIAPQVIFVDLATTSRDYLFDERIRLEPMTNHVSDDTLIETKVTERRARPRRQLYIALITFSTRS